MLPNRINKGYWRLGQLLRIHIARNSKNASDSGAIRPNPTKINSDMIGPVDPVSNLRRIIFKQPANETDLERSYREKRAEVQEWNQRFWTDHNSRFFQDRDDYLKKNLPDGKQTLSADEMSVFYKAFLDKNWKSHVTYNIEWYKRNVHLLSLAIQCKVRKLLKLKDS